MAAMLGLPLWLSRGRCRDWPFLASARIRAQQLCLGRPFGVKGSRWPGGTSIPCRLHWPDWDRETGRRQCWPSWGWCWLPVLLPVAWRNTLQAAGDATLWDPNQAIERASEDRAAEVRRNFGLTDDAALAHAVESYADAMATGGHALAAQWVQACSKAEDSLLAEGLRWWRPSTLCPGSESDSRTIQESGFAAVLAEADTQHVNVGPAKPVRTSRKRQMASEGDQLDQSLAEPQRGVSRLQGRHLKLLPPTHLGPQPARDRLSERSDRPAPSSLRNPKKKAKAGAATASSGSDPVAKAACPQARRDKASCPEGSLHHFG
eukprot:s1818_g11.t1